MVNTTLSQNRDKIAWDIVDHGGTHADNVALSVDEVNDVLEENGLAKSTLGRTLTPKERFEDQSAAYLHDVGRSMGEKSHATQGSKYTSENQDLPLDPDERKRIARLVELHSDGATRKKYGTDDLSDLMNKGLISKEEAVQATSLRIADALDAGKERGSKNSQGQSRSEVMQKLTQSLPHGEAASKLSHWAGHSGFEKPELSSEGGRLKLRVQLDDKVLQTNGGDVAYRVKDILKDVSSTIVDKTYRMDFVGDKRQNVESWLNRYGDVMAEELRGIDIRTGGSA